jgi:hypothetical protein
MEKGWKNIYNTTEEHLITMARDLLEDGGIEAVIINHKDSAYVCWGEYELFVREEKEVEAEAILEQIKIG